MRVFTDKHVAQVRNACKRLKKVALALNGSKGPERIQNSVVVVTHSLFTHISDTNIFLPLVEVKTNIEVLQINKVEKHIKLSCSHLRMTTRGSDYLLGSHRESKDIKKD